MVPRTDREERVECVLWLKISHVLPLRAFTRPSLRLRTVNGARKPYCAACSQSDWQPSSLVHRFLRLLSGVDRLDIRKCRSGEPHLEYTIQWVDLFHWFTAVESLHISMELGMRITCTA